MHLASRNSKRNKQDSKPFRILEGDALNKLDELSPESVNTVFTSPEPPYNYQEMNELIQIMLNVPRVVRDIGSIWVHLADYHNTDGNMVLIPERFVTELVIEHGWKLRSKLIWHRPPLDEDHKLEDNTRFRRDWEYLYWFVRNNPGYYFNREAAGINLETSVLTYEYIPPKPDKFESGFPYDIIQIALEATCPPNGTVLDCFCGTGTTGVVALGMGMDFIGIEANPMLIPMIEKRLANV